MARNWLGMKAPIQRLIVFAQTIRAEREIRHGGFGAVVGNACNDAVTRAAVGAGDEWVTEAPVGRVKKFPQAVGTEG
jgi:hypothetical protein